MTEPTVRRLGPLTDAMAGAAAHPLAERIERANDEARRLALGRASSVVARDSLDGIESYLPRAGWVGRSDASRPAGTDVDSLVDAICRRPVEVAWGAGGGPSSAVKVWTPGGKQPRLGDQVEVESSRILLRPEAVVEAIEAGASVEVRQVDRHVIRLARLADDLMAISGADIYLKLFLAGGSTSANGWHKDATDVVATVLSGTKTFEVEGGIGDERVHRELQEGEGVLVPRARAHCVTPCGRPSALLSVGLMRPGDWAYRGIPPAHLGFERFPRSARRYRLSLRSHLPMRSFSALEEPWVFATRTPGGLLLLEADTSEVTIAAAGCAFATDTETALVLTAVHGGGGSLLEVAGAIDRDPSHVRPLCRSLAAVGLLTTVA